MPSAITFEPISLSTYSSALALPQHVFDTLRRHARTSNVILPHVEKALARESKGEPSVPGEYWIVCSTLHSSSSESIDFILSCTEGAVGSYPIFIFSSRPSSELHEDFLYPRISQLVEVLRATVDVTRVYSVFAPTPITQMFTDLWVHRTGVGYIPEPYYAATLLVCTRQTHIDRSMTVHPSLKYAIRPATESDIPNVADLCYGFALGSEPFLLTRLGALKEATLLVHNSQVWVHEIQRGDEAAELASIVCMSRQSDRVSAITKVYTNPKWRKLGCAERLVRRVCKHLLKTKESIVLYVAHDNHAAANVYKKVGFIGLDGDHSADGVESWLEIGFDRQMVQLGHW